MNIRGRQLESMTGTDRLNPIRLSTQCKSPRSRNFRISNHLCLLDHDHAVRK